MKKITNIIGGIIFGGFFITILIGIADAAFISSDVEKAELALKSSTETYYRIESAYESAKENAKNNCAVLVALKKRDGLKVENENCGLAFIK